MKAKAEHGWGDEKGRPEPPKWFGDVALETHRDTRLHRTKRTDAGEDDAHSGLSWGSPSPKSCAEALTPDTSLYVEMGPLKMSVLNRFLTLWDPLDYSPPDNNVGVGCHLLLQGSS